MARILRDMSEFRVIMQSLERKQDEETRAGMRRTGARIERALISAAQKVAPDRRMSRVGRATGPGTRAGSYIGYNVRRLSAYAFMYVKTGTWQFRDSSVTSGPTKAHTVKPNPKANPRPIPPAIRIAPSMTNDAGNFTRGAWTVPPQTRQPYWANAIQFVQPTITKQMGDEFARTIRRA